VVGGEAGGFFIQQWTTFRRMVAMPRGLEGL